MSFFSSSFKPTPCEFDAVGIAKFGALKPQFEAFAPDPKLKPYAEWSSDFPLIKPVTPQPFTPVQKLITKMVEATWTAAEPSAGAQRGPVTIGARGGAAPATTYNARVRPVKADLYPNRPDPTAIASDWNLFKTLERTDAVTFRGDTRGPSDVFAKGGFTPPNSRTDDHYIENNLYTAFADYLKRRYNRNLDKVDYINAVRQVLTDTTSKKLLTDFMMWKKMLDREAVNLGRMTQQECHKGYISTSRSIKVAVGFGGKNGNSTWVYVTLVGLGFVVPDEKSHAWGTEEQEVAQWGAIPNEKIVGARRLDFYELTGPIYFRPEFRRKETKAFEKAFRSLNQKNVIV